MALNIRNVSLEDIMKTGTVFYNNLRNYKLRGDAICDAMQPLPPVPRCLPCVQLLLCTNVGTKKCPS